MVSGRSRRLILQGLFWAGCLVSTGQSAFAQSSNRRRTTQRPVQSKMSAAALVVSFSYKANPGIMLANTQPDGRLVAQSLRKIGQVDVQELVDPSLSDLVGAVGNLIQRSAASGCALLYIAGHGFQIAKANYILSSDGQTLLKVEDFINLLRDNVPSVMILLDTCRSDPTKSNLTASGRGLARLEHGPASSSGEMVAGYKLDSFGADAPSQAGMGQFDLQGSGVKVVFATDPNNVALDAAQPGATNGPFALSLSRWLGQKISFDEVVSNVTREVRALTNARQSPWQQGSMTAQVFLAGKPRALGEGAFDRLPPP
jgi:Caspase domain